jgi:hypothetical protein
VDRPDTGIGRVSATKLDAIEAMRFLDDAISLLSATISQELRVFAQLRAFGGPQEPGDQLRIFSMARHIATGYETMLDWAADLRGLRVPAEMGEELGARRAHGRPTDRADQVVHR